jgi:DNA-binding response OmpR family regulator
MARRSFKEYDYTDIRVLLVEPSRNVRLALRASLADLGFRDIRDLGEASSLRERFSEIKPDLMVIDTAENGREVCELVQEIRSQEIGEDPFLPIITTTWEPTAELVRDIVNSGADDLLVKPVSVQKLVDRIQVLIRSRKPFVVTSTYIGPDRRKNEERDSSVPLIEVPNILALKARGVDDWVEMQALVDAAVKDVNSRRMERNAYSIAFTVQLILDAYAKGHVDEEIEENLDVLVSAVTDLSRRMVGTKHENVSDLCGPMLVVATSLQKSWRKPAKKEIDLLTPLSQAIQAAFNPDANEVDLAQDISRAVSEFNTKRGS